MHSLPDDNKIHLWRTQFPVTTSQPVREQKKSWQKLTHDWIDDILISQYGLSKEEAHIDYHDSGKPYLSNLADKVNISISHSFELASFAISSIPEMGIDLEKKIPKKNLNMLWEKLNRFEESLTAERFYAVWTQLEAYTKAQGSSIVESQYITEKLLSLPKEKLIHGVFNEKSWYFYTDENDNSTLSIALHSNAPVEVNCLSESINA
ncbi:4'-phosphopantetheinyl transferase family protein [Pleionea sediminis]|uniref:4'-phosphopantetheinyl transferase family protein n=1 Tax=Pleionea sediminis TaxID=2569479 RepID=UPI0011856692|nr:hypothetical protein [Pleionea sediminis]